MVTLAMVFHVADYDRWRAGSDRFLRRGGAHGVTRYVIYRAVDDADEVMLLIDMRSREDAERMMRRRDELRASLDAAEMTIYPAAFLGERAEQLDH